MARTTKCLFAVEQPIQAIEIEHIGKVWDENGRRITKRIGFRRLFGHDGQSQW
jgi:hypothetical protein